tara:strand:+ start:637 stop:945 length:309 start_codon:yes stop_codon:yes gene_type:complete
MTNIIINGVERNLTEDELKNRPPSVNLVDAKLITIRQMRLKKLKDTDYMANSDYTMPSYIKTWRQTLRDLPQNNTTESQYDTLLAKDADGNLTNSVWTQPKE